MTESITPGEAPAHPGLGEITTSALAFWEPRRVLYNLVLAAIVLAAARTDWHPLRDSLTFPTLLSLFILAVLANLCYSAAYIPDVFIQLSRFREHWLRWRWWLWLLGTGFAASITYLITVGGVGHGGG